MKDKKGFTLVELLAVIVILAIILVIAVPKILNVIESTRTESMESTGLLMLDSAEREYATRLALGTLDQTNDRITCSDVASLSSTDYVLTAGATNCTLDFDSNGKATLYIWGAANGKFAGKCIVGDTRDTIEVSTSCDVSE
jgi:type IV pilus assembly protein PilA